MTALRQPRGTGVALRDPLPWDGFAGAARLAEELGYDAVFLPEIAGRDAVVALGMLAGETSTVMLGTGVVPMDARRPRLTAMGAATVQERSGGRMILGIGTGPTGPGALEQLRARVLVVRELLREGLSLAAGAPVPVWIAALGPKALALAGEVADGVLLNWCPPERAAQARQVVDEAADRVGRSPAEVTIGVYVRASLGDDQEARSALQAAAAEYASYPAYARQFAAAGLGAESRAASAAHRAGRPHDVPDALLEAIALVGDRDRARGRLQDYRDAGADLPIVYPVLPRSDPIGALLATIRTLAP